MIWFRPRLARTRLTRQMRVTYFLYDKTGNSSAKKVETAAMRPTVVVKQVSVTITAKKAMPTVPKIWNDVWDNT